MNDDVFKGKWLQLKGQIKEKWGELTDDDQLRQKLAPPPRQLALF